MADREGMISPLPSAAAANAYCGDQVQLCTITELRVLMRQISQRSIENGQTRQLKCCIKSFVGGFFQKCKVCDKSTMKLILENDGSQVLYCSKFPMCSGKESVDVSVCRPLSVCVWASICS